MKKLLKHLWKIIFIMVIILFFTACDKKTEPPPVEALYGTWVASQFDAHEEVSKWQMYITRSLFQINIIGEDAGHIYFNINNYTLVENPRSDKNSYIHFTNFPYGYKIDGSITSSNWYWGEDNYFTIYIYMHKNGNGFMMSFPEDRPNDNPLGFVKSDFNRKERVVLSTLFHILLQLILILPFFIIFSAKNRKNIYRILIFSFCWIFGNIVFCLPGWFPVLDLLGGISAWSGFTYGIICGILCYYLFKRFFTENNFFTIKIEKTNKKYMVILSFSAILIHSILSLLFNPPIEFNLESLLFLLTVSGIYQEILMSGILLGIMASCLKDNKFIHKNYISVILMAVLFGVWHALQFNLIYELYFNIIRFLHTGILGCLLYLITIKSKSIFPVIIVHNLANALSILIQMLK